MDKVINNFKDFQTKQRQEQEKVNQYNSASLEAFRNRMSQPVQQVETPVQPAQEKLGFGDTLVNILKSAGKSTLSGLGNLQGTLFATGQNNRDAMNNEVAQSYQRQAETHQADLDEMLKANQQFPWKVYTDEQIALQQDKVNKANEIAGKLGNVSDYQKQAVEANNQFVDDLSASAQQDAEAAKAGRNAVGRTLVDVGVAGTQLLGDAATNLILPGASLAVMGARSAGGAMQKARQEGADLAKQLGYGAAIGATSILTEKLFDGLAGAMGKGAADEIVNKLIAKITESSGKTAGVASKLLFSFLGEAGEEAIEDLADYIIDKVARFNIGESVDWGEVGYDALIGGILGGLGGTVDVATKGLPANVEIKPQVDVNQENTSFSPNVSQNVANEPQVKPQAETTNVQNEANVEQEANIGEAFNPNSELFTNINVNTEQKVDGNQNTEYNPNVNVMEGATEDGRNNLQAEVGREVSEGRTSAETDTGIVGERPHVQGNLRNDGVVLLSEQQLEPIKAKGGTPIVMPTTSNDSAYENFLRIARESDKQNGWAVTQKSAEELSHCIKLMDANGNVGAAVTEDGDIVAVFKRKNSGIDKASNSIMPQAIAAGGIKLDCYTDMLVNNYSLSGGMKPVCRVEFNEEYANEGWDESKGKPYIYFMVATDTDPNTIIQKQGTYQTYTKEELAKLPTFGKDGYEDAMKYRDDILNGKSKDYRNYLTPEAKAAYENDPKYAKSVHKDLNYLIAAARAHANIPFDVLKNIPALQEAEKRSNSKKKNPSYEQSNLDAMRDQDMDTIRRRKRNADRLLDAEHGSAVLDENGEIKTEERIIDGKKTKVEIFTGPVEQGKKLIIVIGKPAGGKSSVFANPLSAQFKARIVDSDTVKPWIDGYNDGWGAGYVQEDSDQTMQIAFAKAVRNGDNIVLPKVGKNAMSLAKYMDFARANGYSLALYLNEVSTESSMMRAVSRYAEKGRYLSIDYINSIGDKPTKIFNELKKGGKFDYAEWRNNDVEFGEEPRLVERTAEQHPWLGDTSANRLGEQDSGLGRRNESARRNGKDGLVNEQSSNVANETETPNSVGAASINSKDFSDFNKLETKYGVIDNKPNAVRLDDVPRQTKDNNKVSETASTVKGAKITPDDFVPLIEKEVVKNGYSFIPITNNETTKKATEKIQRRGWNDALKEWTADVRSGRTSAELIAEGAILYNNAVNKGDYQGALDILSDYTMSIRTTAQALQSARILKTLTPESRLYMIQKSIDGIIEDMRLPETFEISEELKNKYTNAKTESERDAAINEIIDEVAEQLPVTFMDKLNAIRYMNMLGNFKTQVRNVVGNVAMQAMNDAKNAVATGLEAIVSKVSPKYERTRAVNVGTDLLNAANNDFVNVRKQAMGEKKYSIIEGKSNYNDLLADAMERRTILPGVLEKYRKATNWAMEKGDVIFSQRAYARSLAGYLKAHNVTASQWNDSNWKIKNKDFVDKARAFGIKDAQEATFRDTNTISGWLAKAGRSNSTPKFVKTLMEGLMPFRKTPANIMIRAEEYSPIGFANALVMATKKAKGNVEITGTDIINQLAKSTTGSVIFLTGMLLRSAGLLRGGDKEDEKQQYFDEMQGHQSYSLEIGDTSYTLDWLSPGAIPLFMGVAMTDAIQDDGLSLKDFGEVIKQIDDPMLQMSVLQSVNEALDTIKYSDDNLPNLMEQLALSYLTQALTNTFVGQFERTFEKNRMSTYVDKNKQTSSIFQKAVGKASAKIPGIDYNQYEYINPWGETESNGGVGERIFTNFFSPGYISKITSNETEKELQRIVEKTKDSNLYPSLAEKSFTVTKYDDNGNTVSSENKQLTMEEYSEYAKAKGKQSAKILEDLFKTDTYKNLTDDQKADAIKKVYEYATSDAKSKVSDYVPSKSSWINKAKESKYDISEYIALYQKYGGSDYLSGSGYEKMKSAEKVGLNNEDYIKMKSSMDSDKNKSVSQEEAKWYLDNKTNLTNAQKDEMWSIINSSWKNSPYSSNTTKKSSGTTKSSAKNSDIDYWTKKLK